MDDINVIDVEKIMTRAACAAAIFSQLDQEQTDRIVKAVYQAAFNQRVSLAKFAHEETGLGVWRDKVIKNVVASQIVYDDIKDLQTVGIIANDRESGIMQIAQPLGPIFAVTPVTNPTSTVIFKILLALKTRNPIIISPHRRATKCSIEAARICYEAALSEDAPEDCIQWAKHTTREDTHAFMGHKHTALILATGGPGLVGAAYSSGTPAIGVGAGNVPVFIEESADIDFAVEQILISKTFDNGTICSSEQAIVVERSVADETIACFKKGGGHFLSPEEIKAVEAVAYNAERGVMNADIVGQPAVRIAEMAGIAVAPDTRVLLAQLDAVGEGNPLSSEILAPILAFYVVDGFDHAVNMCIDLNFNGGMGHTASVFSNDDDKITAFASIMNAGRIVVNMPSSQGAVGGIYNRLHPSLTLGCGSGGGNITTDNVTATHLLNIQRVARRRVNERLSNFDTDKYYDETLDATAIESDFNRNY